MGGIGTNEVLSNQRRPTTVKMSTSTREQELRRIRAPDSTEDRHGPLDYDTLNAVEVLHPRMPVPAIGKASRDAGAQIPVGPGPGTLVRATTQWLSGFFCFFPGCSCRACFPSLRLQLPAVAASSCALRLVMRLSVALARPPTRRLLFSFTLAPFFSATRRALSSPFATWKWACPPSLSPV